MAVPATSAATAPAAATNPAPAKPSPVSTPAVSSSAAPTSLWGKFTHAFYGMSRAGTVSNPAAVAPSRAAPAAPAAAKTTPGPGYWERTTRPFKYAAGFVGGTVTYGLDGIANGGRKGSWFGLGVGLIAVMSGAALPGLAVLALGWAAGLVVGALAGGAVGVATGGAKGAGREYRKVKYADDLIEKAREKSQPLPRTDYREAHREYKQQADYMTDRIFQQDRENQSEAHRYFQDHVEHSRMGHAHEHGL